MNRMPLKPEGAMPEVAEQKIVPREPSDAMLMSASVTLRECKPLGPNWPGLVTLWQSMFDAAPAALGDSTGASSADAAAFPDSGWQPIATAPSNVSVLGFIPNAEHYGIYRMMLVDMRTGPHWQVCGLHMGRDCGMGDQPTHWMPLPEPPQ